jgi:hypothetical protein
MYTFDIPRNFDELSIVIYYLLPGSTLGEDSDGQLVIYTDCRLDADDNLIPLTEDN